MADCVSIPQLGWGDFKLPASGVAGQMFLQFQSLNWDGVISNSNRSWFLSTNDAFQSLNWDGVISNLTPGDINVVGNMFQSLNWDGVISNKSAVAGVSGLYWFQSLNWDGVISNPGHGAHHRWG